MSRLDDAIAALRTAAGDRPFVLVYDRRGAGASDVALGIAVSTNLPTYVAHGLFRDGARLLDAKYPIVVKSYDEDED